MKKYVFILISFFINILLFGQVNINGEIRPRSEFRQGYQKPIGGEITPAFFVNQRSRINLNYNSVQYDALLSVQDVRVWGNEKFNTYNSSMALHQAWVKYNFNKKFSAKIGRQTIDIDNKRILSSANWNQSSKKHDAILISYRNNDVTIDFINAFNQTAEKLSGTDYSDGQGNYKYLSTLWVTKKLKNYVATAFALVDGFEPVSDSLYSRITYGAIAKFQQNDLQIIVRYFQQTRENSAAQKVSSNLINLEGNYQFEKGKITFGTEVLSGNDLKNPDGKTHTFEMPYGAKHGFNGSMDYFRKSTDTKNCGLTDIYLKWAYPLSKTSVLRADYHYFSSTTVYSSGNDQFNKCLASEIDLSYKRNVSKGVNVECGYSILKGSLTLQALKGGDLAKFNQWAYVMLTFKPVFL